MALILDWDLPGTTERQNDGTTETEETQMAAETSGMDADKPEHQALENPALRANSL